MILLGIATFIGSIHALRRHWLTLNIACVLTVVGVWIEKGMGMVVPGFVPTPIGEIYEYMPNLVEIAVTLGIWGIGLLLFTLLAKAAVPIECGTLRAPGVKPGESVCQGVEIGNPTAYAGIAHRSARSVKTHHP